MNRWKEQFENHAIHGTLKWLRDAVSTEFADINENEVPEKRRILKILSKYEEVLSQIDPEIVPMDKLSSLNSTLRHQNIANLVNNYAQSGDKNKLTAINDQLTNQLSPLCYLNSISEPLKIYTYQNKLESLIDETSNSLIHRKDSFGNDLSKLEERSENQIKNLKDLENLIDQRKSQVDSHIANWQKQFSDAQESRIQDYNQWRNSFSSEKNEKIDNFISDYEKEVNNYKEKTISEIDILIKNSNEKYNKILELYNLVTNASINAGYIKNADEEKEQANSWRRFSIGFIIATVVWLLSAWYFYTFKLPIQVESTINWQRIFLTFSISGILLWGGAYSAQQSTKHRNNEKHNRRFALEVQAFNPFISTLEESLQKELRADLTRKIFGKSSGKEQDDCKVIDEHALKQLTDAFLKMISEIPKLK